MRDAEVKELAKEVIKELAKQQKDKRLHNTRLLMKNYNSLKNHLENVNEDIKDFEIEVEMGSKDSIWIMSIARSKIRTAKMVGYVESAMKLIKDKFEKNLEAEKFRAFEMYYIDKKTNEEIQEELNCGKNSPKRWSDLIIEELNVLLWGIDALGI